MDKTSRGAPAAESGMAAVGSSAGPWYTQSMERLRKIPIGIQDFENPGILTASM
jgi:hypothetical protein